MLEFNVKASDINGRVRQKKFVALNRLELLRQLSSQNLTAISIEVLSKKNKVSKKTPAVKLTLLQVLRFTKQLRTLLKAGIPVVQGLTILSKQSEEPGYSSLIESLIITINDGKPLSIALSDYPKLFPSFYINCVRVGEKSGKLEDALQYVHDYMSEEAGLKKKVRKAIRYPLIVMVAILGAFIVFTTLVIPNFIPIFEMSGSELPMPTVVLIALSDLVLNYGVWILCAVIALVAGIIIMKRYPSGQYWWDSFWIKFPVIGKLIQKINVSKFTKIYLTLNKSGIAAKEAFDILQSTIENRVIQSELKHVIASIRQGNGVAKSLAQSDYFSGFVIEMLTIGEQSGSLDDMLESINEQYDNDIEDSLEKLIGSIEPVTTVIIGLMVAFLALAMFLPLWDTMNLVG